jgi:hypothetical protein
MGRYELISNGYNLDFVDVSGLPFSLARKIDRFFDLVGSEGLAIDGTNKEMTLPGSKANTEYFERFLDTSSLRTYSKELMDLLVKFGGTNIFTGSMVLRSTVGGRFPRLYSLELLGGELDPQARLENLKLNELTGLGVTTWDSPSILASQAGAGEDALWVPILYGETQSDGFDPNDMRPAIRIKALIEAIVCDYLGYGIVSDFHETDWMASLYMPYHVGDDWKRGDMNPNHVFRAEASTQYQVASGGGLITVGSLNADDETTPPNQDPAGVWNNAVPYLFTAPRDGWWNFTFSIETDAYQVALVIDENGDLIPEQTFNWTNPTSPQANYVFEYSSGPIFFKSGHTLTVWLILGAVDPITVQAGSWISAEELPIPTVGADIDIASTLPADNVKDFLLGFFHSMGIVYRFDNVTKRMFYEPRFDYELTEGGVKNSYLGWYSRESVVKLDAKPAPRLINDRTIEHIDPFGEYLTMGYKEDSNDPLMEQINLINVGPDAYGIVRTELIKRGKPGTDSQNPYFFNLLNGQTEFILGGPYPELLPSYELGGNLPDPTYEGRPTIAKYYGQSVDLNWKFEGTVLGLPMLFQQPPLASVADDDDALTYADTSSSYNENMGDNRGLGSIFWQQYFAIVQCAITLQSKGVIFPFQFEQDDFRAIREIDSMPWIQLCYNSFAPGISPTVGLELVKLQPCTTDTKALVSSNPTDGLVKLDDGNVDECAALIQTAPDVNSVITGKTYMADGQVDFSVLAFDDSTWQLEIQHPDLLWNIYASNAGATSLDFPDGYQGPVPARWTHLASGCLTDVSITLIPAPVTAWIPLEQTTPEFYYDETSSVFTDGELQSWQDRTTNNVHLTNVEGTPITGSNGEVNFDQSNETRVYELGTNVYVRRLFVVWKSTGVISLENIISRNGDNVFLLRREHSLGNYNALTASYNEFRVDGAAGSSFPENQFHIAYAKSSGDALRLYDDLQIGEPAPTLTARNLEGEVTCIIGYSDALDQDTIEKIEGYLAHSYAITLDAGHPYFAAPPQIAQTMSVLMLVEDELSIGAVDQNVADVLTNDGHSVIFQSFSTAVNGDATGHDVVLCSDQGNSLPASGLFWDQAVPVVNWERGFIDDWKFAQSGNRTTEAQTDIDIVNNTHPITSGMSLGDLTVASPGIKHNYGDGANLGPDATVLAEIVSTSISQAGEPCLWVYDTGDEMRDSFIAPARRAMLWIQTDGNMNAAGEALFLEVMKWVAGITA